MRLVAIADDEPADPAVPAAAADVHQGFRAFAAYVKRAGPRLFLHGHQHVEATTVLGDTLVLGVFGERVITLE